MNKQQYNLLKKGFIILREAHKNENWDLLNYAVDIIVRFNNFKDFEIVKDNILKEIEWV